MKTIQVTIDERLLAEVDRATRSLKTSRSAFIREALLAAVLQNRVRELEEQDARGHRLHPIAAGEFDPGLDEGAWTDH